MSRLSSMGTRRIAPGRRTEEYGSVTSGSVRMLVGGGEAEDGGGVGGDGAIYGGADLSLRRRFQVA